eukprot:6452800-Amphidinium_carterae.1
MAEAKQLAEKVDKQTKVIEEAVEKRAAFKEKLVTVILKIKALPPDTVPVPKPSPATSLASSSALDLNPTTSPLTWSMVGRLTVPSVL